MDFITRQSFTIFSEQGFNSLLISSQQNRVIVRFYDNTYEKVLKSNIIDVQSFVKHNMFILALTSDQLYLFEFDLINLSFILLKTFNETIHQVKIVDPPIVMLDDQYYNIFTNVYQKYEFQYHSISGEFELLNKNQTYLMQNNKVIKVFEKALVSYLVFYQQPWVFIVNQKFKVKVYGQIDFEIDLPILTDVTVDYIQAYAVAQEQNKFVFQINVCFIIADKSRMFCKYVVCEGNIIDQSLTLHTNIRTSRTFPSFLKLNALAVTNNLYITENLRDCKWVHTFPTRIVHVYWQQKTFWVVLDTSCQQFSIENDLIQTINDFKYEKQIIAFKGILYNLQNDQVQKFENSLLTGVKHIENCVHLIADQYQLIQVIQTNNTLLFQGFDDDEKLFEFTSDNDIVEFVYLQPLNTFIVKTHIIDIVFYIPLIKYQKASFAQLKDGTFSVNTKLQLCQIVRNKYGNNEMQLEIVHCDDQNRIMQSFDVKTDFNDQIDINNQFDSLNTFSQFQTQAIPFLSMNQFNFIEVQTKYNKFDFPEWLMDFYKNLDNNLNEDYKIPNISIDKLLSSNILYAAPIYHLEQIIITSANNTFQKNKSPGQVALYFVMCNKVILLANLYKLSSQTKIADFLKRDFSVQSNQQSAIKNAFVLLSKHDFDMAIAWFLIGKDYVNAIKILCGNQYFDSQVLAVRVVQILQFNEQIDSETAISLLGIVLEQVTEKNMTVGHYLECFKVNLFIKINFFKEQIQTEDIISLLQNITRHEIQAVDIQDLTVFLFSVHLFSQNLVVTQYLLSLCVSLSLRFSSYQIKILYQKLCISLQLKANPIYGLGKLKEQQSQDLSFDLIQISQIEEKYNFTVPQVFKQKKFSTLIQFLYASQAQFQSYENIFLVKVNLKRIFKSQLFNFRKILEIELLDLIVILNLIFIVKQIFDEDDTCFNCWQKTADYVSKCQNETSHSVEVVESFGQLFKFCKIIIYSPLQLSTLEELISQTEQKELNYLNLVLQERLLFWKHQINNKQAMSQISSFLEQYRINKKKSVFSVPNLLGKDFNQGVYLLQNHPVILVCQKLNQVLIFKQEDKEFKLLKSFEAISFTISKQFLYLVQEELIITVKYSYITNQMIEFQIREIARNSLIKFQAENHYFVEFNPNVVKFHYVHSNTIKQHRIDSNLTKIISLCLTQTQLLAIVENLNSDRFLVSAGLSELLFQQDIPFTKVLNSTSLEQIYTLKDGNLTRFLLLTGSKYVILDEKFESITEKSVNLSGGYYVKNEQFCCSNIKLTVFGKQKTDFCVLCGQEFSNPKEEIEGIQCEIQWE